MTTTPAASSNSQKGPRGAVARGGIVFHKRGTFAWKTIVLAVVTIAFIPVLLYQDETGAKVYVWALILIHVLSIGAFVYGVKKEDIAPSARGLWGRLAGLAFAFFLLGLAEKGLRNEFGSAIFWWSLFGVWALHTGGLALLHLRGEKEQACIFAGGEEEPKEHTADTDST